MNRRNFLQTSMLTLSAAAPSLLAQGSGATSYTLPDLPYPVDALEPHIDAKTMEIHHGRHHRAYVDNLNKAVGGNAELSRLSVDQLVAKLDTVPENIRNAVRNNGGGHSNHTLFWKTLKKGGGGEPKGELAKAIESSLGGFEKFRSALSAASVGQFGSGWGWLSTDASGALKVHSTPNQDSPLTQGQLPLFGIDVWEHAYYLKYQNRRAEYVAAIWNVIDWDYVASRYADRKKLLGA